MVRTRVAVCGQVFTTMEGNAPGARGPLEFTEVVCDRAEARNTPLVIVTDDQARITYEAAIGTVNRLERESLLARG